jgi:hypothetical protein
VIGLIANTLFLGWLLYVEAPWQVIVVGVLIEGVIFLEHRSSLLP